MVFCNAIPGIKYNAINCFFWIARFYYDYGHDSFKGIFDAGIIVLDDPPYSDSQRSRASYRLRKDAHIGRGFSYDRFFDIREA